ncbi:hypothetical protein [Zobellia galactanivorans]|uniref:hypothetical protein n=1 Tax=Zobellia galactanivorans (strain DSM 12802 / CCUG 47099 / CIP 106680 / NCIMB 13871 / Dsij) TaxID=63186 RepID=UPI001C0758A5|nr:hypothetical protein [Zobellia galactanivorans]MBU3024091.1 hypothetical protein [Zobellia galactanivorans]
MEILNIILDHKIKASNVLIELTFKEYLSIASDILDKNEFQRKKVVKGVVRSMLKEDLKSGCTIPAIVLAQASIHLPAEFDYKTFSDKKEIEKWFRDRNLLLIDGLQRTHVLLEVHSELKGEELERFEKNKLRVELYVGVNRLNILYRMLTLNTGQTTMSTRHLMEIMYVDYVDKPIDGVTLVSDKDDAKVNPGVLTEYKLKDVLDGFNSYLEKKEVTIQRSEILDNIKAIENIRELNVNKDLFIDFFKAYHKFLIRLESSADNLKISISDFDSEELKLNNNTFFGATFTLVFKKSQGLSGFGAAIKTLEELRDLQFEEVLNNIDDLKITDPKLVLLTMNKHLDYIKENSKKIGNDQRFYFKWFFRKLFDSEFDYYLDVMKSAESAFAKTREEKYT